MSQTTRLDLKLSHLAALLRLRSWQSASNPFGGPAESPVVLSDLFDAEYIDHDARSAVILTTKGESALQAALTALNTGGG